MLAVLVHSILRGIYAPKSIKGGFFFFNFLFPHDLAHHWQAGWCQDKVMCSFKESYRPMRWEHLIHSRTSWCAGGTRFKFQLIRAPCGATAMLGGKDSDPASIHSPYSFPQQSLFVRLQVAFCPFSVAFSPLAGSV